MAWLARCSTLLDALKGSRSFNGNALRGSCSIILPQLPVCARGDGVWCPHKSVSGSFACPLPSSDLVWKGKRACGSLRMEGSMQRFSNTASCVDFPPWAIQKIQEKRFITDHLTIAEFFAMWDDSPQVKDAKSSLGVAKRLVQKGHVLHHGNTVFLEGDKLAAIVEKSLPWSDATIQNRLAVLRREIAPLENEKLRLQEIAYLRAKCILLAGLAALVVQFATMFHLTYAVYSWSETEPIAYFLRYAITIGAYMYFLKSNRMCGHADVYSWLKNQKLMDLYQKNGFDLGKYGRLSKEIERWERYARSSKN